MLDFKEIERGAQFLDGLAAKAKPRLMYDIGFPTLDELDGMALAPRCLLENFLFADVRCLVAAGGTGKTTLELFEAAHLALGRELWGRTPDSQISTLFVTREDKRSTLYARLREIMRGMDLAHAEQEEVLRRVRILDLSSEPFRLSFVAEDVVLPHVGNIDNLLDDLAAQNFAPDWIVFDPAVSLGVGESRVNDAEQGLVEAARIISNRLDCCVEYIHHTGKANARDKALDQYAGRNGSAFADGSRMIAVMQPLDADEWLQATGSRLEDGYTGLVMALPKLSYCRLQEAIYIRRRGWRFEQEVVVKRSPEDEREAIANQVWQFIHNEAAQGRRYSARDLEAIKDDLHISRDGLRNVITRLKVAGRVVLVGETGKKTYLDAIKVTLAEPSREED